MRWGGLGRPAQRFMGTITLCEPISLDGTISMALPFHSSAINPNQIPSLADGTFKNRYRLLHRLWCYSLPAQLLLREFCPASLAGTAKQQS